MTRIDGLRQGPSTAIQKEDLGSYFATSIVIIVVVVGGGSIVVFFIDAVLAVVNEDVENVIGDSFYVRGTFLGQGQWKTRIDFQQSTPIGLCAYHSGTTTAG